MASSPTSIENQIDSFLEQFKRSASRAMEETAAHHQRSGSYNACSSSISRSRSGNLDLELLEAGYCTIIDGPEGEPPPFRHDNNTNETFAISSGVLAVYYGAIHCDSLLRAARASSHRHHWTPFRQPDIRRTVGWTSRGARDNPSKHGNDKEKVKANAEAAVADENKITKETIMEPVLENNKEKVKTNIQVAVADKNIATKEQVVTDAGTKKNEDSTSKPKKTVAKVKKVRNSQTSSEPTKLEDNLSQVVERFKKGCECVEDECFKGLNPEVVYRHRLNIAELTKAEHDMYLMGVTMACLTDPYQTARHTERRRLRAQYVYQGRRVCLDAFLYLENCTHYQLKRIRKHLMTHGVTPRVHGNHGKIPHNTFSLETYKIAMKFLKNFIEMQETKQKTKLAKNAPLHLPSDLTRKTVHDLYMQYCKKVSPNVKKLGYSTFRRFMKVQFPQVKFAKLEFARSQTAQNHCTTESDARDDTGQRRSPKSEIALEAKGSKILPLVITSDLGQTDTYVLTPIRNLHDSCTATYQVTTRGLVLNCYHD
ncbi:hypothetical protein ALC56_13279 [Trachymyrmex septentrionalis]|uniref:Uncharacterized protein n=1 Tax=Trachymyrmex septentrionalis TaxID=34720 RepID=A0A195EWZ7_9HYME|nr:hypothetical protein ALC56_13279 [Trachymyrmex septentrionalis]